MGFILIAQGVLQALGKSMHGLFISFFRVIIILLPVLYVFSKVFILANIWWAFTITDALSALAGVLLLKHVYGQKVAPLGAANQIIGQ
jgi:Na+-driven multidrug efflux pump